ncbi:MAG: type II secretion system protein [Neobacillus sp.]
MKKLISSNEKGYTLVEILAVIVILGIIASVGLVSIDSVIASSKDKTFVNNAKAIIHAADLYLSDEVADKNSVTKITYEELFNKNYINQFHDPYTGEVLSPSETTYVELTDGKISSVCLYGGIRNLCTAIDTVSVGMIKNN